MTIDVAYSYCTGLSKDEETAIDIEVCRNREAVWIFVRNLPSNAKDKTKRVIIVSVLGVALWFSNVQPSEAMGLSIPPAPVVRVQPSYQHPSEVKIAPTFIENSDKIVLTDNQVDILFGKYMSGSLTLEETILKIRAGGFEDWVIFAFCIWALLNSDAGAFVPQGQQGVPLPHMDPFGWASGKYDSRGYPTHQSMANPPSRFERETLHMMKRMCVASPDENGFAMDYDAAYKLVKKTYQGSLKITNEQNIDYWQACKKIYHAIDFGINPEDYGMGQKQLMKISDPGGLIRYVQEGNPLPPIEFVQKFAETIKDSCLSEEAFKNENGSYLAGKEIKAGVIFSIEATREKITFDKENGSFVSGQRVRLKSFDQYLQSINNYPGKD